MLAQVSTVLSARMLVRETITPPSHQAFQNFLLAAFEMTNKVFSGPCPFPNISSDYL